MLPLKTIVRIETVAGQKVGTIVGRSYWQRAYYDVRVEGEILANVPEGQVTENVRDTFWGLVK